MIDLKYYQELPFNSLEFISNLNKNNLKNFTPVIEDSTTVGKKINMGYLCYALKIYKMTNVWDNFLAHEKKEWTEKLLNYQTNNTNNFKDFFIDPAVHKYFNSKFTQFKLKNYIKAILNNVTSKNYEKVAKQVLKALNADNKQTISTLVELGVSNIRKPNFIFENFNDVKENLDSYDWSKPWDAGAQFSSMSVYSNVFNLGFEEQLYKYVTAKHDVITGSYFDGTPQHSRQVINGAMKVISGLDWINYPIHSPNNLIDFCLENKPEFEGCDLVDYVYVLFKSSKQTNYRKSEVESIFKEILQDIRRLYFEESKGFSYFLEKSQTHYYGIKITNGSNEADIHGTILSLWAIILILDLLELNEHNYQIIKP